MIILFFFQYFIFDIHASAQLGDTFRDDFSSFDTKRWIKLDRTFACLERNCIYTSSEQVQPMRGFIDLRLRKNCKGPRCCLNEICTNYTGGMLLSNEEFTHGSFRFRGQPVKDGYLEVIGQHCSGITSGHPAYGSDSEIAVIAICHIHDRDEIVLFSRFRDDVRKWNVQKFHQRGLQHIYRIDWTRTKVEYFVNGFRVGVIDFSNHVPTQPMKMFVQVLHDGLDKWFPPEWAAFESGIAGAQVILHRVRYIKFESQNEPMMHQKSASKAVLILLLGAMCLLFVQSRFCKKTIALDGGYSELLGPKNIQTKNLQNS